MPDVKLKIEGREVPLAADVTTIGRTPDNDVSFPEDPNVSRHHAEIELRGNEYCLIDLGSSNGTTLNGGKLTGEGYLKQGDVIVLGGTSRIEFGAPAQQEEQDEVGPASAADVPDASVSAGVAQSASPAAPIPAESATGGGSHTILIVAAVIACIAILFVAVAAAVLLFGGGSSGKAGSSGGSSGGWFGSLFGSSCEATAKITKPEAGDTISAATEIELEVENGECVSKAVFTVDGQEFASAEAPFSATIDPKAFPDLSDGVDHSLGVQLIDEDGGPIGENSSVMLAFETRAVTKPSDTQITQTNTQQAGPSTGSKGVSLIEVQEMTKRIAQQFAGKNAYNVSNKQFLTEVQKRTAEYAQEGYFERAARYRDAINVGFVREQNLDASIGFLLAMSRSKFDAARQGGDEGLWRMNTEFVTSNAYNGLCGGESLSDPSQNCAAKASALYMKSIVYGVFDGDLIYSAAVFGKSPQDAGVWKATLPPNRSDVWNSIKTPKEREQLVRFFAAGIVAENPQKFGLKKDRPLSELYRVAM